MIRLKGNYSNFPNCPTIMEGTISRNVEDMMLLERGREAQLVFCSTNGTRNTPQKHLCGMTAPKETSGQHPFVNRLFKLKTDLLTALPSFAYYQAPPSFKPSFPNLPSTNPPLRTPALSKTWGNIKDQYQRCWFPEIYLQIHHHHHHHHHHHQPLTVELAKYQRWSKVGQGGQGPALLPKISSENDTLQGQTTSVRTNISTNGKVGKKGHVLQHHKLYQIITIHSNKTKKHTWLN